MIRLGCESDLSIFFRAREYLSMDLCTALDEVEVSPLSLKSDDCVRAAFDVDTVNEANVF